MGCHRGVGLLDSDDAQRGRIHSRISAVATRRSVLCEHEPRHRQWEKSTFAVSRRRTIANAFFCTTKISVWLGVLLVHVSKSLCRCGANVGGYRSLVSPCFPELGLLLVSFLAVACGGWKMIRLRYQPYAPDDWYVHGNLTWLNPQDGCLSCREK